MTGLQLVLSGLCAMVAVVLVVEIVRDRLPGNLAFAGLVLLEVGLLVQLVWGIVRVVSDHAGVSVFPYLGYLVGALLLLPVGFVWAAAEAQPRGSEATDGKKSRSGTGVLLIAVLVLPVLFLRLNQLWATHV